TSMLTKKMCPQLHFTFSGLPIFLKSEKLITLVLPHFSHIRIPFSLSLTYIFLTSIEHFSFLETTNTYRSHATRGYIQLVSDRNRANTVSAPCRPHAGSVPESHVPRSDGWKRMPT